MGTTGGGWTTLPNLKTVGGLFLFYIYIYTYSNFFFAVIQTKVYNLPEACEPCQPRGLFC